MSARIAWRDPADPAAREAFARAGEALGPFADHDPLDRAATLALAGDPDAPRARASLWLVRDLVGAPGASGLVGHYEAQDAAVGVALLRAACDRLSALGAVRVLGPMNGSTWRRYRLELPRQPGDPDVRPDGFAGEPRNPPRYADDFRAAGLAEVERYESRLEPAPAVDAPALAAAREAARARGITERALEPARFDDTLRAMHALSARAFAGNAYYAPLAWDEFAAQYAPYRARLVPTLVRLATGEDGRLAGYMFGYPDPLSAGADGRPTRVVLKTIAVDPDLRGARVGSLLFDAIRAAALELGVTGLVHALIRSDNVSVHLSAHRRSVLFKRYGLFGRDA